MPFLQCLIKEFNNQNLFEFFPYLTPLCKKLLKYKYSFFNSAHSILDFFGTNFDHCTQIGIKLAIMKIIQLCFSPRKLRQRTNSLRKFERNQRIINSVACFQTLSKYSKKVSKNRPAVTKGQKQFDPIHPCGQKAIYQKHPDLFVLVTKMSF